MKILGIDPGLGGGFALLGKDRSVLTEPMPLIGGKFLDLPRIAGWLNNHAPDIQKAFIELPGMRPRQSTQSAMKFGRVFGEVEGMLSFARIPFELVSPQRWTKVLHQGIEGAVEPKKKSQMALARLYPGVDLRTSAKCIKPHEGMMDALLIAHYGLWSLKIDREFGLWLTTLRIRRGLTEAKAAQLSGIPEPRIKVLESGWGVGIKHKEAVRISRLYGIDEGETMKRAQGEWLEAQLGTA